MGCNRAAVEGLPGSTGSPGSGWACCGLPVLPLELLDSYEATAGVAPDAV